MSTLAAAEVTNEQSTQELDRLFDHSYVLAASAEKPQIYIPEKGPFTATSCQLEPGVADSFVLVAVNHSWTYNHLSFH